MASKGIKFKKLPKKEKAYLLGIISFFAFVLIFGIRAAYAYYNDSASISILANSIGDFDSGDGDINMMIYKENAQGIYVRSYAVPAIGYKFNQTLTKCTITCTNDGTGNCYYSYDEENQIFSLTSDQKVTCKFYFDQEAESDINIYIMKEDSAGTYTYNTQTYSMIESIPAYGYEYAGYYCENQNAISGLEYVSETKKFVVSTSTKNTCYAYFDSVGAADIVANVFVQSADGSTVYKQVESIPANNVYKLSTTKTSACYNSSGNNTGATITYVDGYINITASEKQTCDVYLDLANE